MMILCFSASGGYYWIGATDENDEGWWTWSNSKPLTFVNWKRGEPNNANGIENCAVLVVEFQVSFWMDISCDSRFKYICEY